MVILRFGGHIKTKFLRFLSSAKKEELETSTQIFKLHSILIRAIPSQRDFR